MTRVNCTMRCAHSNDDAKRRAVRRLRTSDKIVAIVKRKGERCSIMKRQRPERIEITCVKTERWLSGRKQRFAKPS